MKEKGAIDMTTKFYINGKKVTRKAIKDEFGEERMERILKEAKEVFLEDPETQNDFLLGANKILTIEFE